MLVEEKEIVLAHEPDAAWIMALYKAIHGGDPPPETVAASVIGTIAPYLKGFGEAFTTQQMEAGFGTLGVKVTQIDVDVPKPQITWPKLPKLELCDGTMASVNGLPFAKVDSGSTVPIGFKPPQPFHVGSTPSSADVPKGIASIYGVPGKH